MPLIRPLLTRVWDPAVQQSLLRVLKLWKPLAVWTLGVWLLFLLVVSPFTAWVLGMARFQPLNRVVGNTELLSWLLRPAGILWLSGLFALNTLAAALRFSGVFLIVSRDLEGLPPAVPLMLRQSVRMLPRLLKLAFVSIGISLITFLPLLGGLIAIDTWMLGEFDINYYLTEQPPVWLHARLTAAVWLLLWAGAAVYVLGRLLLLFPAYLAHDYNLKRSFRAAWKPSRRGGRRLVRRLVTVIGTGLGARILLDGFWFLLARSALTKMQALNLGPRPQALATGGFVLGAFLYSLVIGFLIFSVAATVLTKFYYEDTHLHDAAARNLLPAAAFVPRTHRLLLWFRPRRFLPALLLIAGISAAVSAHWIRRTPPVGNVIISAHRAGPPPAPENTLAALAAAIEAGADFSEIDLQLTRDGVVVVVHDEDWKRVAGSPLRVAETDFAELRQLVQRHPSGPDGSPEDMRRVATLEDFLEHAEGSIQLMIELKYYGFYPKLAEETLRILRESGWEDGFVIMSLDLAAVRQIRTLAPEVPVGFVSGVSVGDLSRLDVDFLAVHQRAATPRLLRNAGNQGIGVHAWTVNRREDMIRLILKGVDGLITDDPALAAETLRELRELTAVERLILRFFHF